MRAEQPDPQTHQCQQYRFGQNRTIAGVSNADGNRLQHFTSRSGQGDQLHSLPMPTVMDLQHLGLVQFASRNSHFESLKPAIDHFFLVADLGFGLMALVF